MPTVDDLRGALAYLADQAPHGVEQVVARRATRRRRRKLVRPLVAAAAAVVALAAVPLAVQDLPTRTPTDPGAPVRDLPTRTPPDPGPPVEGWLPADRFIATVEAPPGFEVRYESTGPHEQSMRVWDQAGGPHAWIILYAPGGWRPDRPQDARDALVGDSAGFYGDLLISGPSEEVPGALAWPYQADAWAMVFAADPAMETEDAVTLTLSQAVTLAERVHIGQERPAVVPARFHDLPGDLELRSIRTVGDETSANVLPAQASRPDSYWATHLHFGPRGTIKASLWVVLYTPVDECRTSSGTDITIGTYLGSHFPWQGGLHLCADGIGLTVQSLVDRDSFPEPGDPMLSLPELTAVVEGMTFAPDIGDRSTWFDAATAVS